MFKSPQNIPVPSWIAIDRADDYRQEIKLAMMEGYAQRVAEEIEEVKSRNALRDPLPFDTPGNQLAFEHEQMRERYDAMKAQQQQPVRALGEMLPTAGGGR